MYIFKEQNLLVIVFILTETRKENLLSTQLDILQRSISTAL